MSKICNYGPVLIGTTGPKHIGEIIAEYLQSDYPLAALVKKVVFNEKLYHRTP